MSAFHRRSALLHRRPSAPRNLTIGRENVLEKKSGVSEHVRLALTYLQIGLSERQQSHGSPDICTL